GKTHLLKLMEKHILDAGFAVSYVSLSRQLNLSNLSNLFPALASHLMLCDARIPGLLNPLTTQSISHEFMQKLPLIEEKLCHPLPAHIFRAFARYDAQNMVLLYNALMGKKENVTTAKRICREYFKPELKTMPKFRQKDHLISFFEFLPYLLQALGYKGWVILIDELEITGKLGKVARLKSYQNLAWLLNWNKQHKLPIYTLAASVKALQEEVFFGKKKKRRGRNADLGRGTLFR
ncbi:MAG: ATP-binding protein, partial [Candidatus Cloacimonetes bacterium]|nr:ATP-binding protein [Candidatus Cloacimonadota bacterium]